MDTLINTPADAPTDAPADAPTDAPAGDAPAREQTTTPLKNKETQKNYTDISNALSNRKNVIPQVSKNAQKIADKLKRAKNQDVVK